jgi:asparagine synthase (glutamine-hydrolysing)
MRGGGLHTIAAVTEYFALQKLMDKRQLSADDVVTNGQTGDFLTGGHIPKSAEFSYPAIDRYILAKHLSLFSDTRDAFGVKGIGKLMTAWRKTNLSNRRLDGAVDPVSAYQTFEWQERQSRLVINQHRAHDFLGLTWKTPLWDADLMDLFEKGPLDLQHHQKLYQQYLTSWNYRGLFDQMRLPYDPWPRGGALIKGFARLAGFVRGASAKAAIYERLAYFGEYHYLYRLTGRQAFLGFEKVSRSPASLFALDHLARVRRALGMAPRGAHERQFGELMAKDLARVPAPLIAAA